MGLCTGLIAASVVASAQSLSDLLELSTEAVRVAYRVGDLVGRVAQDLHSADQSWSTIVVAKEETVRDALQSFHRTQVRFSSATFGAALTVPENPRLLSHLGECGLR